MSTRYLSLFILLALMLACHRGRAQEPEKTYAERLGWPEGSKVVIFHIDDSGMSHSSNVGTIKALAGTATSCSIMMPCPWVPEFAHYYRENPEIDAGLHLTLTSEWTKYRWGPLVGKQQAPGLVDEEGCLWGDVAEVVANATPDEVEAEIRAQIDRAEAMGLEITHLDSHMGTLFATPFFLQRYVKVGIEKNIRVLLPGGHLQYISKESDVPMDLLIPVTKQLWGAGLPVIDDILAGIYDWEKEDKVAKFSQVMREMQPGLLEIILHCTEPSDVFPEITTSSDTRKGDLEAMLDPRLEQVIEEEGVILTTWRELKQRRDAVGDE